MSAKPQKHTVSRWIVITAIGGLAIVGAVKIGHGGWGKVPLREVHLTPFTAAPDSDAHIPTAPVLDTAAQPQPETIDIPTEPRLRTAVVSRTGSPRAELSRSPSEGSTQQATWVWPVKAPLAFSEFGEREGHFHSGLDIAAQSGTPVLAVQEGRVVLAGWNGGYGNCVILDHDGGIRTLYAHASSILVNIGQFVTKGQEIAKIGSTGNSTGPHLHIEVLIRGRPVNPRMYLP